MLRTRLAVLALTAATLFVSGCGGSTKSSGQTSGTGSSDQVALQASTTPVPTEPPAGAKPLTKSELIARADPICKELNSKRATVKLGSIQYVHQLPSLVTYEWSAIAELTKLPPPSSIAYDWSQMLNDNRTIAEVTATVVSFAQANDFSASRSLLPAAVAAEQKLRSTAKPDGFSNCAESS